MKARQERELLRLYNAARALERELLIEIIASKNGPIDDRTTARVLERLYGLGVKPDWWKLEGQVSKAAWDNIARTIEAGDPLCRGIVLLGLEAPEEDLAEAFALAHDCSLVKGFAVGRTIFVEPAVEWFAGRIDDRKAIELMAGAFARLCDLWCDLGRARHDERHGDRNGAIR
jgi:5-dehydro-2-deoxygluconokinase